MRLAYCDDEEIQLEYVQKLVETWAARTGEPVTYLAYKSAKELLFENEESYPFDLLILDIDMEGMNGMELARKIRKRDEKLPILFLTNRREYVFEGYEVQALRYLLKPLDEEKIFPLLDEPCTAEKEEKEYLIFSVAGENRKIELRDILYVEANGHYLKIHTKQESCEIKKSLADMLGELSKTGRGKTDFVTMHRSFFVNLAHMERVMRTECILSDGSSVPISRNCYKAVNEAFIRYYR